MEPEPTMVFVYHNDETNKIEVLSLDEAQGRQSSLLRNGWKHTATLDACRWIQFLYNERGSAYVDVVSEIKDLSKGKHLNCS